MSEITPAYQEYLRKKAANPARINGKGPSCVNPHCADTTICKESNNAFNIYICPTCGLLLRIPAGSQWTPYEPSPSPIVIGEKQEKAWGSH